MLNSSASGGPQTKLQVLFVDPDDRLPAEDRIEISTLLARARREALDALPTFSDRLAVQVALSPGIAPGFGCTGYTPNAETMYVFLDPEEGPPVVDIARAQVRPVFLHESHHAARWAAVPEEVFDNRVIASAVFEGAATRFEFELTGEMPPWGAYDSEIVETWVEEVASLPRGTESRPWRFRLPDGRQWVAYHVGVWVAERAAATLGVSAAGLATLSNDEILAAAGVRAV